MSKFKVIGLVGPSGCGKDSAAAFLETKGYHYVKLCTTRPKRNENDNGYFFLTPSEFLEQVLNGKMLNAQEFRGWYYGLSDEGMSRNKINILPMSNIMVEQMVEEKNPNIDLKIIYIHTSQKDRLIHILNREKNPDCEEVCRRFLSDIKDYEQNRELFDECCRIVGNNYTDFFFKAVLTTVKEVSKNFYMDKIG